MLPLDRQGRRCCICAKNLIEKNSINHRLCQPAPILATSEALFGQSPLTRLRPVNSLQADGSAVFRF